MSHWNTISHCSVVICPMYANVKQCYRHYGACNDDSTVRGLFFEIGVCDDIVYSYYVDWYDDSTGKGAWRFGLYVNKLPTVFTFRICIKTSLRSSVTSKWASEANAWPWFWRSTKRIHGVFCDHDWGLASCRMSGCAVWVSCRGLFRSDWRIENDMWWSWLRVLSVVHAEHAVLRTVDDTSPIYWDMHVHFVVAQSCRMQTDVSDSMMALPIWHIRLPCNTCRNTYIDGLAHATISNRTNVGDSTSVMIVVIIRRIYS